METISNRRPYQFCAKGGHDKLKNTGWVCSMHAGGPREYTHCANCGKQIYDDGRATANYVCGPCLVVAVP